MADEQCVDSSSQIDEDGTHIFPSGEDPSQSAAAVNVCVLDLDPRKSGANQDAACCGGCGTFQESEDFSENGDTHEELGSDPKEPDVVFVAEKECERLHSGHKLGDFFESRLDSSIRHCDVVDLLRKRLQNWRTLARVCVWRTWCSRPPRSCCPLATSYPVNNSKEEDFEDTPSCCPIKSASTTPPKTPPGELAVYIPPGMIGLAWLGSEPQFLSSKSYTSPSSPFSLQELALESTRVIHHGSLHRVIIPDGIIGVAWVDGQAKILDPGIHVWHCSTFVYTTADDRDTSEKEIPLGPYRVVTVKDDEVGIKYCNRKPQLLYTGRHLVDISKVEVFAGFESLRIRKSSVSDLVACCRDDMVVEGGVWFRWQISPQDIVSARAASVADIQSAVITKLRRAFAIVIWCLKGEEIVGARSSSSPPQQLISGPMKAFAADVSKKCIVAVADLFQEGWVVTVWGMWFETLKLRRYCHVRTSVLSTGSTENESEVTISSSNSRSHTRKKKVQIVDEASEEFVQG